MTQELVTGRSLGKPCFPKKSYSHCQASLLSTFTQLHTSPWRHRPKAGAAILQPPWKPRELQRRHHWWTEPVPETQTFNCLLCGRTESDFLKSLSVGRCVATAERIADWCDARVVNDPCLTHPRVTIAPPPARRTHKHGKKCNGEYYTNQTRNFTRV